MCVCSFADDGSGWAVGAGGTIVRGDHGATVGAPTAWALQVCAHQSLTRVQCNGRCASFIGHLSVRR
jgi:hypothetical protein